MIETVAAPNAGLSPASDIIIIFQHPLQGGLSAQFALALPESVQE